MHCFPVNYVDIFWIFYWCGWYQQKSYRPQIIEDGFSFIYFVEQSIVSFSILQKKKKTSKHNRSYLRETFFNFLKLSFNQSENLIHFVIRYHCRWSLINRNDDHTTLNKNQMRCLPMEIETGEVHGSYIILTIRKEVEIEAMLRKCQKIVMSWSNWYAFDSVSW